MALVIVKWQAPTLFFGWLFNTAQCWKKIRIGLRCKCLNCYDGYCHVEDSPTFSDHPRTFPQITWYSKPLSSGLRTFIGLRNIFRILILSLMFLPNYFHATKLYLSVLWLLYYYSSFLWLTINTIVIIVLDSILLVITIILPYELLFRYLWTLVYNPTSLMAGTPVCNQIK